MNLPSSLNDDPSADAAAEIGSEMQRSLTHSLDLVVREWRQALADVENRHQDYLPAGERDDLAQLREFTRSAIDAFERIREGAGKIDHLAAADLSWLNITAEMTRDEAVGWSLWERIQRTARDELAAGATAGMAIEGYHARPIERATFLAIREALADGMQPRNGMERLLIDGMAQAWVMHLRWLGKHVKADSLEAIRVGRSVLQPEEWEPPRLSEAEAVDRAAQMADRFQRQFLRLMKCYRDGRRLIASMTVLGGQVNVAEQQVVVSSDDQSELS
jgi:hypothetical protein